MNILEEFDYRRRLLEDLDYREAENRLRSFRAWLLETQVTKTIHGQLYARINSVTLFQSAGDRGGDMAVVASSPDEIAVVGFEFIKMISEKIMSAAALPHEYSIRPSFHTNNVQAHFNELMRRYINPAIDFMRREVVRLESAVPPQAVLLPPNLIPVEITDSIVKFKKDHPDAKKTAFIMMRFGKTPAHANIVEAIRIGFKEAGIVAVRADDKEYHEDLFLNVATYMHGCAFGVAVFERLEVEDFNPNVALEVGYMQALRKPVCLLKDKTLKILPVDLVGKLYRSFDPQVPHATISAQIGRWLRDKGLVKGSE